VTPVFKKNSCSDPCNYRPIAVLPTLSRVFERVLQPILERHLSPFIPVQQFGFMRGSSCADAGVSLASAILFALDQRAEVQLVALEISIGFGGRASCVTYGMLVYVGELLNFLNHIFLIVTYMLLLLMGFLLLYPFRLVFLRVVYGHLCFLICTPT